MYMDDVKYPVESSPNTPQLDFRFGRNLKFREVTIFEEVRKTINVRSPPSLGRRGAGGRALDVRSYLKYNMKEDEFLARETSRRG